MHATILTLLTLLPVQPAPPKPPEPASLIEIRINPLVDLHYWVRRLAAESGELPAIEGLPAAVAAVRRVGTDLGGFVAWGVIDGDLVEARSVDELARLGASLPESFRMRDGREVRPREAVARLVEAYRLLEKPFLEKVWPAHQKASEEVAAGLRRDVLPKAPEIFADLSRHLDVPVPSRPISVYLVASSPFPRAFTHRSPDGAVCIVALAGMAASEARESMVHEPVHALDIAGGEGDVLSKLEARLRAVPGASPQEVHDFVHTLMFVQAAGTVRKILDPGHKDYGDTSGYYPKVPRATAVVRPAWEAYLRGEISRDAALDRIVAGFAKK